uniref:Sine oculis-binding protein n=1 Tax=Stomoxys calcitrans TaxID=35570 RepID=A0A1I8Q2U5_STOCA
MSTKMSSLNTSANNSPTSAMNSSSMPPANATPTVVKIKKELPSDEIKEFAESTMNELLGWYGFDSVDRLDISAKTSKLLQTAGLLNSQQHQHHHQQQQQQQQQQQRRHRSSRANALMQMHQQQNEHLRASLNNNSSSSNNSSNNNNNSILNSSSNNNTNNNCSKSTRNNYRGNDSTASDHDTRSSRDDDSKSPNSTSILATPTSANVIDEKLDLQNCCWCRRPVPENAPEFLTTTDGPRYCSESCFTQSRRASFKKAKTCDWCKHIRHAVSYVDFHDGASQLQFCSDKCLNQYKMQIFCKETQAHLDMNPHLKEQGLEAANNGANLITPDLWLKNCRSRSASPASTISTSPGPNCAATNVSERSSVRSNTPLSPPKIGGSAATAPAPINNNSQNPANASSYKPIISVAPVSKLMSKSPGIMPSRQSPKHNRKKRPLKSCATTEITNTRHEGKTNCPLGGQSNAKTKTTLMSEANRPSLTQASTPSLTQFAASCVQDLHMSVPPLSPMLESPASQPTTPHSLPPPSNTGRCGTSIPPAFFATPPNIAVNAQTAPPPTVQTGAGFPPRPPFMHNPPSAPPPGLWPRFLGNFAGLPQPSSASMMPPDFTGFNALIGTPPPVTVMVPYPVIIPLPIPIPVPLPVIEFYKAHLSPEERKKFEESRNIKKETEIPSQSTAAAEEPLDFTKTKGQQDECRANDVAESPANEEHFIAKEEEMEISQTNSSNSPANETPTTPNVLHCVISSTNEQASPTMPAEDKDNGGVNEESLNSHNNDSITASCHDMNDESNEECNQRLPKLKITRLQTKRLIQTKESECSRPLRKRKRIIDCDFQKISVNSKADMNDDEMDVVEQQQQQHRTTEMELNNKGQNNNK